MTGLRRWESLEKPELYRWRACYERQLAAQSAECARLRDIAMRAGKLLAEVGDWADRLSDGDDLSLQDCLDYDARCTAMVQECPEDEKAMREAAAALDAAKEGADAGR